MREYDGELIADLERRDQLVAATEVRDLLGWSDWQWRRRVRDRRFPRRVRRSRLIYIASAALAEYLREENDRTGSLALSAVAARVGRKRATLLAMIDRGEFPPPAFDIGGRDRWRPSDVGEWERAIARGLAAHWGKKT